MLLSKAWTEYHNYGLWKPNVVRAHEANEANEAWASAGRGWQRISPCAHDVMPMTSCAPMRPMAQVFTIHNMEFGQQKLGEAAYFSQRFTTVSPTYAFEVRGGGAACMCRLLRMLWLMGAVAGSSILASFAC